MIDYVVLEEKKEPIKVYTFDSMPYFLVPDAEEPEKLDLLQQKRIRVQQRLDMRTIKEGYLSGEIRVSALFETDPELIAMRQMYRLGVSK
jgi:hypothetical protein